MKKTSLKEIAIDMAMRFPKYENKYYAITIIANQEGKPCWSCYSHWVGFEDDGRKVELRQASLIVAPRLVKILRNDLKEGCFVVDTVEELRVFLLLGGHAIIEKEIAEVALLDILKPQPSVQIGFAGFRVIKDLPKTIFQKAPTKKQRMRILKRDNYRCKICGRSPYNNVDITIHVHHIRQWAKGGVTDDANLITLCHTCHEGLDPHNEISLFGLLSESEKLIDVQSSRKTHIEGVKRYRKESFKRARKQVYFAKERKNKG